jgi:aryl-alcohol dehydrogenase-like predicted oxidoreductase
MAKLRPLGKTGLQVTEIGFGALEIGRDWASDVNPDSSHLTQEEASTVLNGLLDLGVNFIDTAPAYWHSEEYIGKTIAHRRQEYILATKVGEHCDRSRSIYDYSHKGTVRFIDHSLRRLKTDHIDLIQIHSANVEVLERGETLAAMLEARQAGKVLHIGMTGGIDEAILALELGGYETVQVPYSLLNLKAEERLLALAREKEAGVIIMRGLAGGKLSDKYRQLIDRKTKAAIAGFSRFVGEDQGAESLVHLALEYILARPEVSSVIVGSRRLEAVAANLQLAEKPVSAELLAAARAYAESLATNVW